MKFVLIGWLIMNGDPTPISAQILETKIECEASMVYAERLMKKNRMDETIHSHGGEYRLECKGVQIDG